MEGVRGRGKRWRKGDGAMERARGRDKGSMCMDANDIADVIYYGCGKYMDHCMTEEMTFPFMLDI
jgi:hypothetical protein